MIFSLFDLLGLQLSPRIRDLGDQRLYRLELLGKYEHAEQLLKGTINAKLILSRWDDLLRVAGSLRLGTVSASAFLRTLQRDGRPATLARAIGELGRLPKTLHLLAYLDDEAYRRRILTQLNRGEGRHALARALHFGQKGEVRQRYREGQEDQLGALGLLVNIVVLWNTRYIDLALAQLRHEDATVRDEDVGRLSPLGHAHINLQGHYHFGLPEAVARGVLRPLRDPAADADDDLDAFGPEVSGA